MLLCRSRGYCPDPLRSGHSDIDGYTPGQLLCGVTGHTDPASIPSTSQT